MSRYDYIDYAKGLGILLVVWAHINSSGSIATFIYFFHMPLFFFISGMLFNKNRYASFKEFVIRKAKGLLLPYAIYSVVTWLVWCIYNLIVGNEVESYWMPLLQTFIAQGSQGYLVHNTALWFVPCLFVIEVMYYGLSYLPKVATILICLSLPAVNLLMIHYIGLPWEVLPFNFDVGLMAIAFLLAGNMVVEFIGHNKLNKCISHHRLSTVITIVILFVALAFSVQFGQRISMGHSYYGESIPLFYLRAFVGISIILLFAIIRSTITDGLVSRYFRWAGKMSFDFMSLNVPIKGFVIVVVAKMMHIEQLDIWTNPVNSLIPFAITIVAISMITVIINRYVRKVK